MTTSGTLPRSRWLAAIRRYLLVVAIGNLTWEVVQLPLYTLWNTGTGREIVSAVLHCTLGDFVIAAVGLVSALALVGSPGWPDQHARVVIAVVAIGSVGYTIYSEFVNTVLQRSWAYTTWMPRLPWMGTGLAPLAQRLVIPSMAHVWAGRAAPASEQSTSGETRP